MANLKEKEKEFKKQVIIEEAYRILSIKPYETVTVDEIAKSVGCGKGTLYQYFESKEHILTHLISQGLERLCQDIEERCSSNPDVIKAINVYLDLQFNFFLRYNQIFSSWLRTKVGNSICADLINEVQSKFERKVRMVAEILERGIREKLLIEEIDSFELARLIEHVFRDCTFAFMDEGKDRLKPDRVLRMIKIILSHGLLRRQDGSDSLWISPDHEFINVSLNQS